jgi:hypothetical protein
MAAPPPPERPASGSGGPLANVCALLNATPDLQDLPVIAADVRYAAHAGVLIGSALAALAVALVAGHRSAPQLVAGFCIAAVLAMGLDLVMRTVSAPEKIAERAPELAPWAPRQTLAGYLPGAIACGVSGLAVILAIGWLGGVSPDGIGLVMGLGVINAIRAVRCRRFAARTGTSLLVAFRWRGGPRYYVSRPPF